jgi:hypothetical protein
LLDCPIQLPADPIAPFNRAIQLSDLSGPYILLTASRSRSRQQCGDHASLAARRLA